MRLALRHQILLAPATVLLLMTLLLGFLQYTYWDLSLKRQQGQSLKTVFIALAEADLAAKRMLSVVAHLSTTSAPDPRTLEELNDLYAHLTSAITRIDKESYLEVAARSLIQEALQELNPENGIDGDRMLSALSRLRPQLNVVADVTQRQREQLRDLHGQDIEEIVARTAFVSIVVLGASILLGVLFSLAFAHRILRRIKLLSAGAGRIAAGDLKPVEAPARSLDELDDLALSINHMTERLIRVVSTEKLLEGAEEERRRIAMDIHDQTLADLSTVLRGLQELHRREACQTVPAPGQEPCRTTAAALENDLQRAISNLRGVMDDLHPQTLDILGLGPALQSYLEQHLLVEGLPVYQLFIAREIETLAIPRQARLALYRIAVEAIHNVIKHAHASRYEITLALRHDELLLTVEDNGRGFTPPPLGHYAGRGLNNIRERARAIGGRVAWERSRFSSGTRFELLCPLSSLTTTAP